MKDAEYIENICKIILEIKFPKKFKELKKSESPDWHTNKIGIEVRRATEPHEANFSYLYKKYVYRFKSDIPNKLMLKLGFNTEPFLIDIKNNVLFYKQKSNKVGSIIYIYDQKKNDYRLIAIIGKVEDPIIKDSNLISNAFRDKISKLNKHYEIYDENDSIFVIDDFTKYGSDSKLTSQMINKYLEYIKAEYMKASGKHKFDFIYLLFYDSIIEINCCTWDLNIKSITNNDWNIVKNYVFKPEI